MTDAFEFLRNAKAYAKARWGWDDPEFIGEMFSDRAPGDGESPQQWVDAMALNHGSTATRNAGANA